MLNEIIKATLQADSSDMQNEFKKAQGSVSTLESSLMKMGGVLAGAMSIGAVVSGFNSIRESIDELGKQASRLQMPVEELQKLSAVAALSDTSVEALGKGLTRAGIAATDASQGSAEIAKQFAILGIEIESFRKLNATDQLGELAKGFNGLENRGDATAAIFKIMGKGALELIPVLQGGADGIAEISSRLNVLDEEGVRAIEKMNDEMTLLSTNLKNELARSFISLEPIISGFIGRLHEVSTLLSDMLDPASGAGRQGGESGGVEMLKSLEAYKAALPSWQEEASKAWLFRDARATGYVEDYTKAIDALTSRYEALDPVTKVNSERLVEFERIMASGVTGEELTRQLKAVEAQAQAKIETIRLEKEAADAAGKSAGEKERELEAEEKANEEREKALATLSKELDKLREKNKDSVIDRMFPAERMAAIKAELDALLAKNGVGDIAGLTESANDPWLNVEDAHALQKDLEKALALTKDIEAAEKDVNSARKDGLTAENDVLKTKQQTLKTAEAELKATLDKLKAQEEFTKALADDEEVRQTRLTEGTKAAADLKRQQNFDRRANEIAEQGGMTRGKARAQLRQQQEEEKKIAEIEDLGRLNSRDRRDRRKEINNAEKQEEREQKRMDRYADRMRRKEDQEAWREGQAAVDALAEKRKRQPAKNAADIAADRARDAEKASRENELEQLKTQKSIDKKLDALAAIGQA